MSEMQVKNRTAKTNGNRKALVAAACVVVSLAVLIIAFLAAKSPIYLSSAEKKAENGEFSQAAEAVSKSVGEKAEILEKYILLRLDIIRCYPGLLTEFNIDKINSWKESVDFINENSDLLSAELAAQAASVSQAIDGIVSGVSGYEALREDVLSMMDVFPEINRLHTKGDDGKNIGFTVAEERAKIQKWEQQCAALEEYAVSINGSESVYLLNYLIKEAQGECVDLSEAIDSVIESGYSETDRVRFSGEGRKSYPDIRSSSNESVNLLEKEKYERYVYKGICRALVENLGEFYMPE